LASWRRIGHSGLAFVAAAASVTRLASAWERYENRRWKRRSAARRSQAEMVPAWPGPTADPQAVTLLNGSDEPVYEAVATFVFIEGVRQLRGEEVPPT
jgi:hypothetical protein